MDRSFLSFVLLSAVPALLSAQTTDSTRLKDLVVTATRRPTPLREVGSSTDQLRTEEVRRRQLTALRDALRLIPGTAIVATGAPGGVGSLFLRGVASTQTLFLLDGVRVNDADASYGSLLGGAELSGLDRLEVVRGPQSTLYGGAAIGGVVSLQAAPGHGRPRGEAELDGGSFSSWKGSVSGQAGTVSDRLGVSFGLTANGTDNQRHPNDWDQRSELVRVDARLAGALRAGASFRGLQHEYTSPGDLRSTNTTPEGTTTFRNNLGTVWLEALPVGAWHSKLIAGFEAQRNESSSRYDGGPESLFTLRSHRKVLDWQNTISAQRDLTLVAGLNQEWSTVTSDGAGLDERLTGFYGEALATPLPQFTLTAGIRSDDYRSFGRATTFRVTGAWLVEQSGTKLRASFGTGFMPPSLSARFGSVFQNPNPDIRPEHARGWDVGIDQEWAGGKGSVAVTWFRNSLRDLIGFEGADYPALGKSVNIDRARTSGLELGGHLTTGRWDGRLAYTWLSAKSLSETDPGLVRLIRRPRHSATVDVLFLAPRGISLGAGALAVADREDSDFNTFPSRRVDPGDYLVARVYGAWEVHRLTFRARIENLFDAEYEPVYGFPALGRSLSGSLAVRF